MLVAVTESENGRRKEYSEQEFQAMQRTVINIFNRWGLTDGEAACLLGGLSPRTLQRWKGGRYSPYNRDLADRMSLILGIHKALRIIFSEPARGYAWVGLPNEAFGGRSARDVMMNGGMADLAQVRRYLDSVRGGW